MTVKEFCERYNAIATKSLKDRFIDEKLKITSYVPFIKKDAIINNLLEITMKDKETGNVKVNSSVEYLLMTRIFIENYTNLTIETEGFYEEYDELKKSGLFDILLIGDDSTATAPLIPYKEITEVKFLLAQKKADYITNHYEIHSFITEQVDRLKALGEATLTPLMDVVSKKLDEIPKEDLDKIVEPAKSGNFREV
jgi:hypothetical protein